MSSKPQFFKAQYSSSMRRILFFLGMGGIFFVLAGVYFFVKNNKNSEEVGAFGFLSNISERWSKEEALQVDLVLGGDIMLSRGIGRRAKKYGYDRVFTGENFHPLRQFSCREQGSCELFFNLESPFSHQDNDQPKGGFLFRSNPENLRTLLDLRGGNNLILSLANNHISNAGGAGVDLTRYLLSGENIAFLGAGASPEIARSIYKKNQSGLELCFGAYSYDGTFNRFADQWLARNPLKIEIMLEDLRLMQEQACDVKIFSLHRGAEYRMQPSSAQVKVAHQLIEEGADIIVGGHSHVPGKIELYQGKPIFYSMGNFLFDQDRGKKATERGFDYIYDHQLQRKTVPTYVAMLAHLTLTKKDAQLEISFPQIQMSRVDQGIFSPLDERTKSELFLAIGMDSDIESAF